MRGAFNTASADLEHDDLVKRFKKNDSQPTAYYNESIDPNQLAITIIQILAFVAGAIVVGFLFKEADIEDSSQIKTYFASVFISAGILLIILDLLITVIGIMLIKNRGIRAARCMSAAIIFGFIGFKRIRCLQ